MDYKDIFTIASWIVIVVITYKVIADEIRIYKSKLHQPTDRIIVNGRQLLEKVLKSIELKFGYDEENIVIFKIDGDFFRILISDDGKFLFLQQIYWYEAPMGDIENLELIKRAVNYLNRTTTIKYVYSFNEEQNTVNLHSMLDMLWIPEIPDLDQYLWVALSNLTKSHQGFYDLMDQYRQEQKTETNQKPN